MPIPSLLVVIVLKEKLPHGTDYCCYIMLPVFGRLPLAYPYQNTGCENAALIVGSNWFLFSRFAKRITKNRVQYFSYTLPSPLLRRVRFYAERVSHYEPRVLSGVSKCNESVASCLLSAALVGVQCILIRFFEVYSPV